MNPAYFEAQRWDQWTEFYREAAFSRLEWGGKTCIMIQVLEKLN